MLSNGVGALKKIEGVKVGKFGNKRWRLRRKQSVLLALEIRGGRQSGNLRNKRWR